MADPHGAGHPDTSGGAREAEAPPEDWVVVVEATAEPAYRLAEVKELVNRLAPWQSSALYSFDRHVIQLHVVAASPYEALAIAVAEHDQMVVACGLKALRLLGAEVLTPGERPSTYEQAAAERAWGRVYDVLVPTVLYDATRSLLQATTRAEIDEVVAGFVIAAGGTVTLGEFSSVPDQVSVDLGLSPGDRMFASAEAISIAGLMIEKYLPALVHDAERMLARLHLAGQVHLG